MDGRVVGVDVTAKGSRMSEPTVPHNGSDQALGRLERRVRTKREDVDRYLAAARRQRSRLVQVTIVAGSIAAGLTAGPALGGKPLADWLTDAFRLNTPAWRILCLAAMLCSLAATIATQLHKSNNYEEHIVRAQDVRAALEALDFGIVSGHLGRHEAMSRYLKCVESASFIDAQDDSLENSPLRKVTNSGRQSSP